MGWALHTLHTGCAISPKTPPLRGGWTRQQSAKFHHHNRRETSETTPHLHSVISYHPFHHDGPQDQWGATYLLTQSHSSNPHGPLSLSLVPLRSSFRFPPQKGVPTSSLRKFWQSRPTSGDHTDFYQRVYSPASFCPGTLPLILTPFRRTMDNRWCLATLTPTIPPGSLEQEMIGQRPQGKRLMGRSIVRSSLLRTKTSPVTSPPRASPPFQISLFWSGMSFPVWRGPRLTPLGLTTFHNRLAL